ncbi:hypothetical protein BZ17_4240 (plasmid) [Yersinia pseudotuberculosis IP 32953]|nr:hypothetical protein CH47_4262 [Yersinia enterocolitica]AJJ53148.1 hypothetical protein BZ17_4240 [Yersinia pseudotuberculosis IP 32953]AJK18547.1 hypothetical protein BZ19_4239 [Yersinia pseudotuberculosis str. PA3606]KNC64893.1 hypothetical protein M485_4190 [Yersinia pestis 14735]UFA63974.1 Uncharacterized protein YP598_4362 [Yersinia pseudotuberculosis]
MSIYLMGKAKKLTNTIIIRLTLMKIHGSPIIKIIRLAL